MIHSNFISRVFNAFDEHAESLRYSKGDFLTRAGETEKHIYLLKKGAVKIYYLTKEEEHIVRLGYNGSLFNSLSSFLKEEPSELYIEALKQSTIKRINKRIFAQLIDEDAYQGYAQFLETLLMQQLDREIDLLQSSPIERLNRVLKRSPQLFEHIPLKYIASYLRMSPETLSRIRK